MNSIVIVKHSRGYSPIVESPTTREFRAYDSREAKWRAEPRVHGDEEGHRLALARLAESARTFETEEAAREHWKSSGWKIKDEVVDLTAKPAES